MNTLKPKAKADKLIFDRSAGTVVYDSTTHRAHSLNRVADMVLQSCDGNTTVAEITEKLRREVDPAADTASVEIALGQLRKARLLEPMPPAEARLFSRREISAGAAVLVPVVSSLLVPSPAAAKSGKIKDPKPKHPKKPHPKPKG